MDEPLNSPVGPAANLPEGYKITELGPLPKEWEVVRLGEVATIMLGQSPPSSTYNTKMQGIPFLQGKAEFGEVYPRPVKWCTSPQKIANRGSVLISVRAPVGDVNLAADDCCIGRGLAAISCKDDLDNWFLFNCLRFSKTKLEEKGTGSTFQSISKDILQCFLLPLPPLREQRAIARVLRTMQQAKETAEHVIQATLELKKSLVRHLFTYGPVPVDEAEKVPLKETEIGLVPEHWEVVRLGEIANIRGGKRLPKGHKFSSHPTPYPYVRVADFENHSADKTNLKFITPQDHELIKQYTISSRDVYVSIAGTIGLVGAIPPELDGANLTENAAKIVFKDLARAEQRFLVYFLASEAGQAQISSRTTKTSQPKLALARIRQIPIPYPSIEEQRAIVHVLESVDKKLRAEQARKQALETLFNTLLHNLMTGRIRVKDIALHKAREVV